MAEVLPSLNIVKIDQLPSSTGVEDTDTLILSPADGTATKQITIQNLRKTAHFGGGSIDYRQFELEQSDLSASVAYAKYPYEYQYTWTGCNDECYLNMIIQNSDDSVYTDACAIEGFDDYVKIYFAKQLTGTVTVTIYLSTIAEISDSSLLERYVLKTTLGDPTNLTTTQKSTIVGAINEVDGDVGTLTSLNTIAKNNLVAAINEVFTYVPHYGTATITTTDWTASSTYSDFAYEYSVSVSGITADYHVDANLTSGAYADDWAVESGSGSIIFYTAIAPTESLTFKYWYQKART